MPKARITDKGLIQEPGDGFSMEGPATFTGGSTFSGSVVFAGPVTASQGLVCKTPRSGTGDDQYALVITASEGSSADHNAILLFSTGTAVGTNTGIGSAPPTGGCTIFFDPHFRAVGAGSDRPSLKYRVGNNIFIISASTA